MYTGPSNGGINGTMQLPDMAMLAANPGAINAL